jgi:hypothetical protein
MGLLDLPAPLLSWIDTRLLAFLPGWASLLVWAVVAAIGSMEVYRVLSPQRRIQGLEAELRDTQRRLDAHEGNFREAWGLIRRTLALALRRVLVVFPATVAASLPLLVLIVWLDATYARELPPAGDPVGIEVAEEFRARWVAGMDGAPPRAEVLDGSGAVVADVAVSAPIPVIHKPRWWNVVIGNPAGYLPRDAVIDRIDIDLPRQQFLSFGPGWVRGWEVMFFSTLILFALIFKVARGIR